MKIYKTQEEIEADIKDGVLLVDDNVKFEVSFLISASLIVNGNINAKDIIAKDITARNINARNITASNISARNINAWDIKAWDINAGNISFFACCFAYSKFVCDSIYGMRPGAKYFCLDGEVEISNKE